MELKSLRDWLFEVLAILLPGSLAVVVVVVFAMDPNRFIMNPADFQKIEQVLLPFGSQALDIIFFLSISFIVGHLVQQITNPLLSFYAKILRIKRRNRINSVFEIEEIRKYLLPKDSEISDTMGSIDYFLMVYPDIAPKTKRDTFITVADFCGGVVSLLTMITVFFCFSIISSLVLRLYFPVVTTIVTVFAFMLTIIIFVKRSVSYKEFADEIVVNYFLSKYGDYVRENSANISKRKTRKK